MARYLDPEARSMFRAVITTTTEKEGQEPSVYTAYFGPYSHKSTAKAQITAEERAAARRVSNNARFYIVKGESAPTITVTGRIERSPVAWEHTE